MNSSSREVNEAGELRSAVALRTGLWIESPTSPNLPGEETGRARHSFARYRIGTNPTCAAIFCPSSLIAKSRNIFASPRGAPFV